MYSQQGQAEGRTASAINTVQHMIIERIKWQVVTGKRVLVVVSSQETAELILNTLAIAFKKQSVISVSEISHVDHSDLAIVVATTRDICNGIDLQIFDDAIQVNDPNSKDPDAKQSRFWLDCHLTKRSLQRQEPTLSHFAYA